MVGNAAWFLAAQIIALLAGLGIIRIVDPATYGAFGAITAAFGVVSQWLGFRSWEATVKYLAQFLAQGDRRRLAVVLQLGYLMDGLAYVLTFVVLLIGSRWLAVNVLHDVQLAGLVSLYGLSALCLAPYATANAALRAAGRFPTICAVETLSSLVRLAGVVVVAMLPEPQRLVGLVWVNITAAASQGLLTWWQARRALGPLPRVPFSRATWHEMAGYRRGMGSTLMSSNLIAWLRPLYRGLDLMLVTSWLGAQAGGLYAAARKFSDVLGLTAPGAQAALGPELSRLCGLRRYREAARLTLRFVLLLLGVTGGLGVVAAAVIEPLIGWWQPEYLPAVVACRWLLLAVIIYSACGPAYPFLVSSHQPVVATFSFAATAVTQMLAFLLLRPLAINRPPAEAVVVFSYAVIAGAVSAVLWYGLGMAYVVRSAARAEEAAP